MKKINIILLSITLASGAYAATLELKSEASVVRSDVRVVDVLAGGSGISDEMLMSSLGASPLFGQERIITRSVVENALSGSKVEWTGSDKCKVKRPSREVMPEELRARIEAELKKITNGEGAVKVFDFAENNPFHAPKGDAEIHITFPNSVLNTPWSTASVRYMIHGETLLLKTIRFRWAWERGVWIANKNLQQNETLRPEDFTYVPQDVLQTFGQAYMGELDGLDRTLTRSMQAGTILNTQSMKERTIVERGSEVVVNYRKAAVAVSMKGTALEDGGRGQVVAVRNNVSKKKIFARVVDLGVVEYAN